MHNSGTKDPHYFPRIAYHSPLSFLLPTASRLVVPFIKNRLNLQKSLYTILQVLSISLFERASMFQLLTFYDYTSDMDENSNHYKLFTDYS